MKPKIMHETAFRYDMENLIIKGEHADYFRDLIKQFDHYQNVFEKIFIEPSQVRRTRNQALNIFITCS